MHFYVREGGVRFDSGSAVEVGCCRIAFRFLEADVVPAILLDGTDAHTPR